MIYTANALMALGLALASTASLPVEPEGDTGTLVSRLSDKTDSPGAEASFMRLCRILREESAAGTATALQDSLCQQLAATEDPTVMRRVCLVLRVAPRDDAVATVVDRLQPDRSPEVRRAACNALQHLVSQRPPKDSRITELALTRLGAIIRDRRAPLVLTDAAVSTVAAFGTPGFDTLIKLRDDPNTPKQINNIFYTALSETGDLRALPILRAAVVDPEAREGHRIQAANAIGGLFALAERRGLTIEAGERTKCWQALYPHLTDEAPDMLFRVALKSLAEIAPIDQDAGVLQALNTALSSSREVRREAALDVLYQTGLPLDAVQLALVRSAVESDAGESLRATATAVLEQRDLHDEGDVLRSP